MKRSLHILLIAGISGLFLSSTRAQNIDTATNNTAIRKLVKNYEDAWNRHDPKALAASYSSDATWVNWFGAYYIGRQDIEDHYRTTHNGYFKQSHYYTRAVEDIQYLKPDVAIAHVRTGLSDDTRYPGEVFEFRRMIVLTKKNGTWLIQAGQNAKLEKGIK
ncbi:SgcJ/EcaC family oxidoreductase [Mucilaginibacter terrenus]|uniref:SgcJ/EcaC family oxidoreductase n=1 Tax=Mucilaginibacter terrenus TaxID=2482727 RepID=A0A3E2NW38_9SPHI|nr:SgcJ/EcaC family oxidoreductase [Mucilaginibacter terrenus]RFZ85070.1 SgcJ/EcaC family oxidoreductase [Mucilaginibacter terrenus]